MKSKNPILGRDPWRQTAPAGSYQQASYQQGQFQQPHAPGPYAPDSYGVPGATTSDRMTVDDVVMKVLALLGVVFLTGAASWVLLPRTGIGTLALFGAFGVSLVLGLVISFKRITNPAVILTYAAAEGVLLGLISRYFEDAFSGIVLQAVVGTLSVFGGMAVLYRFRVIRATPTFQKWLFGATIGLLGLMLVNWLLSAFGVNGGSGLGLRQYDLSQKSSWLMIGFSLLCIGVAALTFIQDFAIVEDGVARGVERRFGWYASFGILVGLVWLYIEMLRLIAALRR